MPNREWNYDNIDLQQEVQLGSFAQDMYEDMAPVTHADKQHGWPLAQYCNSIGVMFQDIEDLVRYPSNWSDVLDPDTAPIKSLGWLAQFVGVRLTGSMTEDDARAAIRNETGWMRGTPQALREAARRSGGMVGFEDDGVVNIFEFFGGDEWAIHVTTLAIQTNDDTLVEAALLDPKVKPAGVILTYATQTGMIFQQLTDSGRDFADVDADFTDFDDLRDSDP
jgi:hypothetical protein